MIDIQFEAGSANIVDLLTVVSLKENTFKRGSFDVDIRKEDGNYHYTQEGVQFTHTHTKSSQIPESLTVKVTNKSKVIATAAANANMT